MYLSEQYVSGELIAHPRLRLPCRHPSSERPSAPTALRRPAISVFHRLKPVASRNAVANAGAGSGFERMFERHNECSHLGATVRRRDECLILIILFLPPGRLAWIRGTRNWRTQG